MSCREDDLSDLDVTVTSRPHQSEPMQMPGNLSARPSQAIIEVQILELAQFAE